MKILNFPTYQQPAGRGKLFSRYFLDFPMSLVKYDGTWHEIVAPSQELLSTAEAWYLGGYYYPPLTDAQAADLGPTYWVDV